MKHFEVSVTRKNGSWEVAKVESTNINSAMLEAVLSFGWYSDVKEIRVKDTTDESETVNAEGIS